MTNALILIADDDDDIRLALELLLAGAGYRVISAATPQAVRQQAGQKPDLVLLDMNFQQDTTSGKEGLALLAELKMQDLPVILMTAWASIELAVAGMQQGARSFIQKPWNNQQLLQLIRQQLEHQQLQQENQHLKQLLQPEQQQWVAESPAMQQLEQLVQQLAPTDASVLILGENGTGKSLLASRLHQLSKRSQQPLVAVNMAAIPESLFEAELFGHEKGAFTDAKQSRTGRFALAGKGSLFLDEVGCLPPQLQPKLLRVLESGEFEAVGSSRSQRSQARIISATNADLQQLVKQGLFRQDLLYRLNTFVLELPPLRQRQQDIPLLCQQIMSGLCQKYHKPPLSISPAAMQTLLGYPWPGNVRELTHTLERAVLLCQAETIQPQHLLLQNNQTSAPADSLNLAETEQRLIQQALASSGQQLTEAARLLGISRHALARRLEKYPELGSH
ncbi:sigma-54-dependent transcriptional regulator [Alkalimonas mucilaginosa]|uniref:Sigma-54 dependent transcriptional regulator n=1 Tax=Alkalimonas mucilaginosa TaxID=3057676 RepID=A0ABU7JFE3_9GAMM|nr:sigma-54 dependent transcriptional regulator [Alkalimonas sp. MEB004]MEE2024402.1 sigma-54 dependent transcriptional regulator [Alkalimonas sp. MEB004]